MYGQFRDEFQRNCDPLDWDRLSDTERESLLKVYGSRKAVRLAWESKRDDLCSTLLSKLEEETGQQIMADIWAYWKSMNRSRRLH
jgi:hypothetical protein